MENGQTPQNLTPGLINISDSEFEVISRMIYTKFGIHLTDQKKALVVGRLNKVLRKLGFSDFKSYYQFVLEDDTGEALAQMIDRISTNHSYFYREKDHYELMVKQVLPELAVKLDFENRNEIRIWSAGCAAGEEVYTIAMQILEYFKSDIARYDIGLLATDISLTVLREAQTGIYPLDRLRELPADWKKKYFRKLAEDEIEINGDIKKMVLFKRLNLMNSDFPFKGQFDIIFCRNVMIYFDAATRMNLVKKFYRYIRPGGWLFIGHSESLSREESPFKYVMPAVYRKEGNYGA